MNRGKNTHIIKYTLIYKYLMNLEIYLKNFFISLSFFNFDELFYDSITMSKILFTDVFPRGSYSVVGNSPIILKNKNGINIDKSDYVIRFNNFKINNYEKFIGTKTNILIINGNNELPDNISEKNILFMDNNISFKDNQLKIIKKYTLDKLSSFIIFNNQIFLNKIKNLFGCIPSTGFIILLLLSIKYKNINTYGFSFEPYNNKYHYCDNNKIKNCKHNPVIELLLFKILIYKKMLENKDFNLLNKNNKSIQKINPIFNKIQKINNKNYKDIQKINPIFNKIQEIKNNDILTDTNNKLIELNKLLNIL